MKERLSEEVIAARAAKEIKDGDCVNIGAGLPTEIPNQLPYGIRVFVEAENGVLGYGPLLTRAEVDEVDFNYIDAAYRPFHLQAGMSFFDQSASFDMIRGGHLDAAFLGAFQVSEKGDLANWSRGDDPMGGIGGAMDVACCTKKVICVMRHTTNDGSPRILKECTLPLTAKECVDMIITDLAVIEVTEGGLVLKEVAPGWTAEEVQELTGAPLCLAPDLKEMEL